jgi:hypothetical protein
MTMAEYQSFIEQIIHEDGNLDCVPDSAIFCTTQNKSDYHIWLLPEYRRSLT